MQWEMQDTKVASCFVGPLPLQLPSPSHPPPLGGSNWYLYNWVPPPFDNKKLLLINYNSFMNSLLLFSCFSKVIQVLDATNADDHTDIYCVQILIELYPLLDTLYNYECTCKILSDRIHYSPRIRCIDTSVFREQVFSLIT